MKTLVISLAVFSASFPILANDFLQTIPARGEPHVLSFKEYPIELWRTKSQTNFPWFAVKENGWYIDWDCERTNLSHIVVHHTAGSEDETSEDISDTVRERIYRPVYQNRIYKTPYVHGLPIHSGHVVRGEETFTAYHHLIYSDGTIVTTLVPYRKVGNRYLPEMVAWGAGSWPINCGSIQIALVGTWSKEHPPNPEMLAALKNLIAFYRTLVPEIKIVGHYEVRPKPTECPGDWWPGWIKTIR